MSIVIKDQAIDLLESLDQDPWNHRTLATIITIILVLCAICSWPLSSSRPPTNDSQRARTALQALQTVLVLSCSLWPARYIKLVKNAPNHRSGSRIIIPLSMLLQDVCDGVTELRDPLYDLEDLILEGVYAYGCSVRLSDGWKWWVEWLDWMLRGEVSETFALNAYMLILGDDTKNYDGVYSSNGAVTNVQHTDGLIPLAAAPSPSAEHGPIQFDGRPLTHLSTIQLPQAYANILAALSTKLTYDPVARQQCIDELGIKGWRTRRLMLEFEAVLVRRGWLERWNVVLEAR
ncbi:hypothetical protein EDB19DRAFT_2024489 [Suillus lakei]|nr:hypothetical protein EDB19DRAFT_2024489 [Suillus lakei]